jgi:hypothetical protein
MILREFRQTSADAGLCHALRIRRVCRLDTVSRSRCHRTRARRRRPAVRTQVPSLERRAAPCGPRDPRTGERERPIAESGASARVPPQAWRGPTQRPRRFPRRLREARRPGEPAATWFGPARRACRYGRVARPLARATRRAPRVSRRCSACGQYRALRGRPAAVALVPTAVSCGLLCSPSTQGYMGGLILLQRDLLLAVRVAHRMGCSCRGHVETFAGGSDTAPRSASAVARNRYVHSSANLRESANTIGISR